MKKTKKKRCPNRSYSGDPQGLPVEIVIVDEPKEAQMLFVLSNRGLKMLKSGLTQEKNFIKDGKPHRITLMHRDIYDESYKPVIEMKQRHLKEKARQEAVEASANESPENEVK